MSMNVCLPRVSTKETVPTPMVAIHAPVIRNSTGRSVNKASLSFSIIKEGGLYGYSITEYIC